MKEATEDYMLGDFINCSNGQFEQFCLNCSVETEGRLVSTKPERRENEWWLMGTSYN